MTYSLFFAVTFGMTSVTMFYYTNVMKGLFKDYEEVTTVTKFWDVSIKVLTITTLISRSICFGVLIHIFTYSKFMEGPLLKGLYWEYAYNAGTPRTICPGGEEARALGPCPLAPSDRNILYENRLLGLPRYSIDQNTISRNKIGIIRILVR